MQENIQLEDWYLVSSCVSGNQEVNQIRMMPDTLIRNAEEMHTKIAPTPRGLDLCETLAADFLGPVYYGGAVGWI